MKVLIDIAINRGEENRIVEVLTQHLQGKLSGEDYDANITGHDVLPDQPLTADDSLEIVSENLASGAAGIKAEEAKAGPRPAADAAKKALDLDA